MPNRVQVIHEACPDAGKNQWALAFQWCQYIYEDGTSEHGYRFIWRRPNGNLQGARGQARIPSMKELERLVKIAKSEGWGDLEAGKAPW